MGLNLLMIQPRSVADFRFIVACGMDDISKTMYKTDWFKARPVVIQKAYQQYPLPRFYETGVGAPARIYGFYEITEEKRAVAQTLVALPFLVNDTLGGHDLHDLRPVEFWTERHLRRINTLPEKIQNLFLEKAAIWQYLLELE